MIIKYQILKKRNNNVGDPMLLHPPLIGDEIYEFDTIQECETKIEEIKNMQMYSDVELTITEVYYDN